MLAKSFCSLVFCSLVLRSLVIASFSRLSARTHLLATMMVGFSTALVMAQQAELKVELAGGFVLELARVQHGSFERGSRESESGRKADETLHGVDITNDFLIGKYPVTVGQFKRFVSETNYKTEAEAGTSGGFGFDGKQLIQSPKYNWKSPGFEISDNHPVCLVTVEDASQFVRWLSKKSNLKFTLPSEAQWEYACRAGTNTRFYSGDETTDLDKAGWFHANAGKGTRPVGLKEPNAFGIYDMSGNVFEWCSDIYAAYPKGTVSDPLNLTPDAGEKLRVVMRGGSWLRNADKCRSAARERSDAKSRNAEIGFRVCSVVRSELSAGDFKGPEVQQLGTAPVPTRPDQASPQTPSNEQAPHTEDIVVPTNPQPAQSNTNVITLGLLPGCICLLPIILLIIVVFQVIRSGKSHRQAASPDFSTRNAAADKSYEMGQLIGAGLSSMQPGRAMQSTEDGFWLETQNYTVGAVVDVEFYVNGARRQQSVIVQSFPKQFVYTGDTPTRVTVLNVMSPATDPFPSNQGLDNDDRFPNNSSTTTTTMPWIVNDILPDPPTQSRSNTTPPFRGHPPAY